MSHIPRGFYDAAKQIYKPIALEAEGGITATWDLNYVTIGWAEGWTAYEPGAVNNIPSVDKAKWISNGKAMHNWCDRWSGDKGADEMNPHTASKTAELQVRGLAAPEPAAPHAEPCRPWTGGLLQRCVLQSQVSYAREQFRKRCRNAAGLGYETWENVWGTW
jgi:hypothetical protein